MKHTDTYYLQGSLSLNTLIWTSAFSFSAPIRTSLYATALNDHNRSPSRTENPSLDLSKISGIPYTRHCFKSLYLVFAKPRFVYQNNCTGHVFHAHLCPSAPVFSDVKDSRAKEQGTEASASDESSCSATQSF